MPVYEFKDETTGEVIEKNIRLSEYDQFLGDNPHLKRYYSKAAGLVSDSKSPLTRAGKDWQNHLDRIKKGSGKSNTIKT